MKKKLVVLLAVVMMFAFSASAYAATFSDMDEQSVKVQDSVAKAVALGIIDGYEDGTFGPDQTITRAEFAKIAVTAAGAKDTATMLEKNTSSFKDVKANSWYTGWINAGESLGIFLGDPNGNFRPNDTISNQEVITVLMRLLGYNDNLTGTWPVNYVTKANQIEMLDDVTIVATAPATRADVAVMLDAALDTYIVTYDKDTNEFVYKQTGIRDSEYILLLEDSFKGAFVKVDNSSNAVATSFPAINQLRDANAKTLNWTVAGDTYIIDNSTVVSHNGESLFDLEGHQGKIYFVKDGNKLYARFIEVQSYTRTASDDVVYDKGQNKVSVLKTNYNAYYEVRNDVGSSPVGTGYKWTSTGSTVSNDAPIFNSNAVLYFNDDDQVYMVMSDKLYEEKAFFVKTVGTNTVRLVGDRTKTINMKDGDALIYDQATEQFVTPSELKVDDALIEIKEGDIYVRVEAVTGKLARSTGSTAGSNLKYNLAGKNYLVRNTNLLDGEYEDAGIALDDVYGNDVKFILNKDNTVAAMVVDETSTGTTLFGVIVDDAGGRGTWSSRTNGLVIFTSEGKTVSYDFDKDFDGSALSAANAMGTTVAYKLNKDNEIKSLEFVGLAAPGGDVKSTGKEIAKNEEGNTKVKVEIKNNAYVTAGSTSLSLASNVVIFEVDVDSSGDVDPTVVTRSSLLAKSNLTTGDITIANGASNLNYFVYDTNSAGAVKVMAYTKSSSTDYHYGIIATWNFASSDGDHCVTFKGDDNVYELDSINPSLYGTGANGKLLVYTQSGDKVTPVAAFAKQGFQGGDPADGLVGKVAGNNSGLISFEEGKAIKVLDPATPADEWVYNVMTDSNTLVFVVDAVDGTYSEGSLSDISRGSWVYIPVMDDDDYADVVIIDDYGTYKDDKWN